MSNRLSSWRRVLAESKVSRWPGPRPLTADDRVGETTLLVGRDAEKASFRREVVNYRLILLTGVTGIGKTSLLEAGLVPELQRTEHKVAVCRDWSGSADNDDPVEFLSAKVRQEFIAEYPDLPDGDALFWALNDELHEKCVIVLDQFEEVIRDAPTLTTGLFELLTDINHLTDIRVVISFRSEYLHALNDLEREVKSFTTSHFELAPVDPSYAADLINAPGPEAITEEASDLLAGLWQQSLEAAATHSTYRYGRIGLLHLQAVLYVLASHAKGGRVEIEHVKGLLGNASPRELFVTGLRLAVEEKMQRCYGAARSDDVSLSDFLVDGTRQMVVDTVPHLSSAGYKLVRDVRDLASMTLGQRKTSLLEAMRRAGSLDPDTSDGPLDDSQFDAALQTTLDFILSGRHPAEDDLLSVTRRGLAEAADKSTAGSTKAVDWVERLHEGLPGAVADPASVTCGPMFGAAPAAVLLEELRRFVFALEWLRRSDLIRISTPGRGGAMVTLIHDGFGAALQLWTEDVAARPEGELAALTAPRGGSFEWNNGPEEPAWETLSGDRGQKLITNLRWRGAWVTAVFRRVTFLNCDFRGAGFSRCRFEGVAFVNCLLDGAMFSECVIVGASPFVESGYQSGFGDAELARQFIVRGSMRSIGSIERHRGSDLRAEQLLSQLPGLPAVPVAQSPPGAVRLLESPQGLIIYGGRISSLVFRSIRFREDSRIAFRYVAGSGLDIVEQRSGSFEIHGSAIRHLTLSRSAADSNASAEPSGIEVRATGSSLHQLWIGAGVTGTLTAEKSQLLQVWNGSDAFVAGAHACDYHGVVGFELHDGCRAMGPDAQATVAQIDGERAVAKVSRLMDYRRDPSRLVNS